MPEGRVRSRLADEMLTIKKYLKSNDQFRSLCNCVASTVLACLHVTRNVQDIYYVTSLPALVIISELQISEIFILFYIDKVGQSFTIFTFICSKDIFGYSI